MVVVYFIFFCFIEKIDGHSRRTIEKIDRTCLIYRMPYVPSAEQIELIEKIRKEELAEQEAWRRVQRMKRFVLKKFVK
jgi:hypothetical protein